MTNNKLFVLRNTLIDEILLKGGIEITDENKDDTSIEINIIPEFMSVTISLDEITVVYAHEHDEFFKDSYTTDNKWIKAVSEFIVLIATNTVTAKYFLDEITMDCLSYEIWVNQKNKPPMRVKKVSTHTNPLALFRPKKVVSKVLNFIE